MKFINAIKFTVQVLNLDTLPIRDFQKPHPQKELSSVAV